MSSSQRLISTLKKRLKAEGITYAQIARHLGKSEAAIKRLFSCQRFTLQTLEAICELIGLDVVELASLSDAQRSGVRSLKSEQEMELVRNPKRLLVAVCALNQWSLQRITSIYKISESECLQHLLELDRLGLIDLLPGNRIKIKVARDFSWIMNGPIHIFFRKHVQMDFLGSSFDNKGELMRFQHAMITPEANLRFQQKLKKLLAEFADMHEECKRSPAETLFGTSVLCAIRPWEPAEFEKLRRAPDTRDFLSS